MKAKAGIRINKYLAERGYATRTGADDLIKQGVVYINGRRAVLGAQVTDADIVEVRQKQKKYHYYAYNKPAGIETDSPLPGMFPLGRLDKKSKGLLILTDDARVTDRLLNPKYVHDKEYRVRVRERLASNFKCRMEYGVNIEGYRTRECTVTVTGEKSFMITLTEGKKHQIRRMCAALKNDVTELERVRVMNIRLAGLHSGATREITGTELKKFLTSLGL